VGGHALDVVKREDAWPALGARRRRWAELSRMVFAVDVEVCPRVGGATRIIGFVTRRSQPGRVGPLQSVTFCGNMSLWARRGEEATSSSREMAITRPGTCTSIEMAGSS
jgi:hypothetical protein